MRGERGEERGQRVCGETGVFREIVRKGREGRERGEREGGE